MKQWQFLQAQNRTKLAVGGYGSGKTLLGAYQCLIEAVSTPWNDVYGEDDYPISLVIGKSEAVLRDSSLRTLKSIIPPCMIREERKSPGNWYILIEPGHKIVFRSWSGSIEGINVAGSVWIDEAHLLDADAFLNYVSRARDPRANKVPMVIITGVPEFGWLYELFGPNSTWPDLHVAQMSTYDNTNLSPEVIKRIEQSCSAHDARTYLRGEWMMPEDSIYHTYDPSIHLVDNPGDRIRPCHMSIDPGERAAVLWLQEAKHGWHVVDELTPDRKSVEQIMRDVVSKPWRFQPGYSICFVDPTTGRDQLNAIERALPSGVQIIRKRLASDVARQVEYGLRCVNAALMDSTGRVRLTINKNMPRGPRSLITSMPRLRRHATSLLPIKDNMTDHIALDCLRYPIAHLCPLLENSITVR